MAASTATADTPLRQAWPLACRVQAGGLTARSVNVLFQGRLPSSRLHAPVSRGVLAVSSRTLMNNAGFKTRLAGFSVSTVQEMGWTGLKNGELLALAEQQFDAFITADQQLRYQQNLAGRRLAILVLPVIRFQW